MEATEPGRRDTLRAGAGSTGAPGHPGSAEHATALPPVKGVRPLGALLFASGSLSWAVSQWVLVWLVARFAGGADSVGQYALALSIATPVYTLAQCGLRIVYLSLPEVFPWRTYVALRLAGLAAASLVGAFWFGLGALLQPELWASVLLLKALDSYLDLVQGRLQRAHRLVTAGALSIANSAATIAFTAVAVLLWGSLPAAILASALVTAAVCIAADRLAAKDAPRASTQEGRVRIILRAGIPTALSEGLAALASYLPVLLLAQLADASRVGVLTTASYLLTAANLAGSVTKSVCISSFRESRERGGEAAVRRRANALALRAAVLAAACVPVVILLGDPVLRAVYGDEFGMGHAELALLALAAAPIVPSEAYATALSVLGRFTSIALMWGGALVLGAAVGVACVMVGVEPLAAALAAALCMGWCRLVIMLALVLRGRER